MSAIRPYLFSFFVAILYKLGIGTEWILRIIELIISLFGVFLTYAFGKKLFNPKVGLVASFIMSFFYLSLFYTSRIMVDIPSMVLLLLTFYLFWEGYVLKKSNYYIWIMGLVLGLSYLLRFPSALAGGVLLLYLLITEKLNFLKNKHLWIAALICFVTLIPYFIYFYIAFDKIPVIEGTTYGFGEGKLKFDFYLGILPTALQSSIPFITQTIPLFQILLLLLVYGLGYMLFNVFLGFDIIRKEEELKKYVFILLWLIMPYLFFSMIELAEDRYMFYIYPGIFIVISFALIRIADYFKKYHKFMPHIIIALVLFSGLYTQLKYADSLINLKSNSYVQLKDAGLWIKSNSNKEDIVLTCAKPQITYYAERSTLDFPPEEEFEGFIKEHKPRYMIVTLLERCRDWSYPWPQNNPDKVKPVQAFFMDPEKTQLGVVIYEFISN